MGRSVTIDECTEGYLVKDFGTNKTYAVSKDRLVQKVKELLGITDKRNAVVWVTDKKDRIDILRDVAKEMAVANPEPFISGSSDSTFWKHNIDLSINSTTPHPFVFTEIGAFEVSVQPITKGKAIYWLHPGGKKIKISRDQYKSIFIYANISDLVYLHEHPADAPTIIKSYGKATYGNKTVVLRGFLKDVPLSALVGDNHYNDNDVITVKKDEPKGQEDGSCDDIAFESCANNTPEKCKYCIDQSRYENKNKLSAKKPALPLMKASVPP